MPRGASPAVDLAVLLPSWELQLRAERKSSSDDQGLRRRGATIPRLEPLGRVPATLDRATVTAFVADLLDAGAEPATARSRQLAVRRFSALLAEEKEISDSKSGRLVGMDSSQCTYAALAPALSTAAGSRAPDGGSRRVGVIRSG